MSKITNHPEPFEIDTKRFSFNSKLTSTCPKCGEDVVCDFGNGWYCSYPIMNEDFDFPICCVECNFDWNVRVRLTITLSLVESNPIQNEVKEKE